MHFDEATTAVQQHGNTIHGGTTTNATSCTSLVGNAITLKQSASVSNAAGYPGKIMRRSTLQKFHQNA